MSLEHIEADPLLEDKSIHLLSHEKLLHLVEQGNAEALYVYATRLRLGIGVMKDAESSVHYTAKAAKLGHPVALGFCFNQGIEVVQDRAKAIKLFRESAARGHPAGSNRYTTCYCATRVHA